VTQPPWSMLWTTWLTIGGAVPSIVAIGLLVWPMIRRPSDADAPPRDRVGTPNWDPRPADQPH
jgi:hypothetical protein